MKRFWISLTAAVAIILSCCIPARALEVNAAAGMLIDANTGRVIYALNEHESLPVASTTKIMTALITMENAPDLSAAVTLGSDFVNVGESSIYLEPGETHTLLDMLYAMMIRSANDAAQALAIGVSGSERDFVKLMNFKNKELGLSDSHWMNVHGLDANGQFSSAYDLSVITRQALQYDIFNTIISTEVWTIPWADYEYDRVLYNINELLDTYEYADGVKTGFTDDAGQCLVASATREGTRLIGVLLNCENRYENMVVLLEYGFDNYSDLLAGAAGEKVGAAKVIDGDLDAVDVVLDQDAYLCIKKRSNYQLDAKYDYQLNVIAPIQAGDKLGVASFTDDEGNITEVDLVAGQTAEAYTFGIVLQRVWQMFIGALTGLNK